MNTSLSVMAEHFGRDRQYSFVTVNNGVPSVRIVDCYYEGGCFYMMTNRLSEKMKHIAVSADIALCGDDMFFCNGRVENMGYIYSEQNTPLTERLKVIFTAWFDSIYGSWGEDMILLRIKPSTCHFRADGKPYDVEFSEAVVS